MTAKIYLLSNAITESEIRRRAKPRFISDRIMSGAGYALAAAIVALAMGGMVFDSAVLSEWLWNAFAEAIR